ncbi:MAG TPA: hypothetical protein VGM91_01725 [Conexibacter sp.]
MSASSEAVDIAIRLLDEAHQSWQVAQERCATALSAWLGAGPGERSDAHLAYRAALDHEEAAARDLERLHRLIYAT